LSSPPHSGNPADASLLNKCTAGRCNHRHPEGIAAQSRPSHLPLPLLEAIECALTTIETPVPSCTSSYRRRHLEAIGTRRSSNQSRLAGPFSPEP
jgi:hypothetical protein